MTLTGCIVHGCGVFLYLADEGMPTGASWTLEVVPWCGLEYTTQCFKLCTLYFEIVPARCRPPRQCAPSTKPGQLHVLRTFPSPVSILANLCQRAINLTSKHYLKLLCLVVIGDHAKVVASRRQRLQGGSKQLHWAMGHIAYSSILFPICRPSPYGSCTHP